MDRFDVLVVGAGFAGCTVAERLAGAGKSVLLIDARTHLGGNAYDRTNADGLLVHEYGPHIFHTNSQTVLDYLSRFTSWRSYTHRVLAAVDGTLLPVPINRTTLAHFHGNVQEAYAAIIRPYTRKQWGLEPEKLDPSVFARVSVRDTDDDRYFTDRFQVMPADGYTALFERMVANDRIGVLLGASYRDVIACTEVGQTFFTGPIDAFFEHRLGPLPYRSAVFSHQTFKSEQVQPVAVINYPAAKFRCTRQTEFKHLTGQQHPWTVVATESPTAVGDPYWPVPTPQSAKLAAEYKALAATRPDVTFLGRLGSYQYLNMDQAVAQAIKAAESFISKGVPQC